MSTQWYVSSAGWLIDPDGRLVARMEDLPKWKADAALIVAACNACSLACPANPIAAAEALPQLISALRDLLELGASAETCEAARSVLARIEAAT